jgi:long-chain fatty acid transport protein
VVASLGGSLFVGKHWRFDAVWAHVFAMSVTVDPNDAKITRINPLPGNATPEYVNGGNYSASANIIGVGLNYRF